MHSQCMYLCPNKHTCIFCLGKQEDEVRIVANKNENEHEEKQFSDSIGGFAMYDTSDLLDKTKPRSPSLSNWSG